MKDDFSACGTNGHRRLFEGDTFQFECTLLTKGEVQRNRWTLNDKRLRKKFMYKARKP
jgi:hypothetical protein